MLVAQGRGANQTIHLSSSRGVSHAVRRLVHNRSPLPRACMCRIRGRSQHRRLQVRASSGEETRKPLRPGEKEAIVAGRDFETLASTGANLLLWAAFVGYALLYSPNQTPFRDAFFIEKLVGLADPDTPNVNEVFTQLFLIMGVWPLIYASLLIPSAKSGNKIPAWPFVGVSFGLGVFALGPFFACWRPASDVSSPPKPEELKGWQNSLLRFTESPWAAYSLLLGSVYFVTRAALAGPAQWANYASLFDESRLVHVTTLDFLALTTLAPFWLGLDAQRRGWVAGGPLKTLCTYFPLLGPALYLVLRPRAQKSKL